MRTRNLDEPFAFAKYQIVAHLADGRMGDVYKAKSHGVEGFEKILCVKIIDRELADEPGFIDTLIDEAKRAVSLSHANVAQVYDLGREEEVERFYIANEYVNGFDLARALDVARRADREWPRDLSIYIASEAAKGIDYAHRRKDFNFNNLNLLHRDVSPTNILISFDGEVKLTDFGISRAMEVVDPIAEKDPDRRFLYASPEHARGATYTRQSDIFSLGLVLYEMLTGFHPYREGDHSVAEAAKTGEVLPLGEVVDVPQQLQRIVDSMLVPDPAGRAESAGTVYEELIGFLFGNNFRADNRALSLLMEELRQAETQIDADASPREAGLEEISRADVEDFYDRSSSSLHPPVDIEEAIDRSEGPTPAPTDEAARREVEAHLDEPLPDLPGGLESCFESARSGEGKAVLMSGHFGRGAEYLPDRICEVLAWRGNAESYGIHATPDDVYRPFGVISETIVRALTEGRVEDRTSRLDALEQLDRLGAQSGALELLRGLWGEAATPPTGYDQRRQQLVELFVLLLRELSEERPVVLVVDRVERADSLTLDVLRDAVGHIDELPVMIVLATSADELMRAAFDIGRPESLKAIRVSAPESGDLGDVPELSSDASEVLLSLALSEQPMSHDSLARVVDVPVERIARAAEELAGASLVRTLDARTLLTGISEASVWVKQRFNRRAIETKARALCRFYASKSNRGEPDLQSPTRIRLHATARQRRRMLNLADNYSDWLERNGWLEIALDFYDYCGDLMAQEPVGSPQARISYLLSRAELALELSRLDQARSSLEPLRALSETVRNEQGFVRSQLLFGRMAMQQDDLDRANECFRRAANIARGLRQPQLLGESLLELAGWARRYGDTLRAQHHLEGTLNLWNRRSSYRMDLDRQSTMHYRAVRIFAERDMIDRAKSHAATLRSLADSTELGAIACRSALGEAAISAALEKFEEALGIVAESQQIARRLGRTSITLALLRQRSALALEAGRYDLVLAVTEELVDVARRHDDRFSEERGRDMRATAQAIEGNDRNQAMKRLRASLERATERNIPRDIFECHRHLALALEAIDEEEAREHRRSARRLRRWMRSRSAAA